MNISELEKKKRKAEIELQVTEMALVLKTAYRTSANCYLKVTTLHPQGVTGTVITITLSKNGSMSVFYKPDRNLADCLKGATRIDAAVWNKLVHRMAKTIQVPLLEED